MTVIGLNSRPKERNCRYLLGANPRFCRCRGATKRKFAEGATAAKVASAAVELVQYFLNDFLQMRRERNMMSRRIFEIAAVAATLAALPAAAKNPAPIDGTAAGTSGHFSVVTGETVATGRDMLSAELGFPGFTFGYTHGINDRFDAGLKLGLLYGF